MKMMENLFAISSDLSKQFFKMPFEFKVSDDYAIA